MTQVLPLSPGAADPSAEPIQSVDQLVERLRAGCKQAPLKVGMEHEKFGIHTETLRPLEHGEPGGLESLLAILAARYGHTPLLENGRVIALMREGSSISLEPGGQLELSAAPVTRIKDFETELDRHFREVSEVGETLGIAFFGAGYRPLFPSDHVRLMPKARYERMSAHMAAAGSLGLDMMRSTCTVQANVDFTSEADMGNKLRTALGVSGLVTALFAASPMARGKDTGWQSHRMRIWTDTDNTRSGLLEFALRAPATFRQYVEWALDVPLIFIRRGNTYHTPPTGMTLRRWMQGEPGLPAATLADFDDLLSTLFPDVRLKTYLETRTADCGPRSHLLALAALWKGLLYDESARLRAWNLVASLSVEQHQQLRTVAARDGLRGTVAGLGIAEGCVELCLAAQEGLRAQASPDEAEYLAPMLERARTRRSFADEMLETAARSGRELLLNLARVC